MSLNPLWFAVGFAALTFLLAVFVIIFKAGGWYKGVNMDRQQFKDFMVEIRRKLDELLLSHSRDVVRVASPLQLTDEGENLYKCLDAKTLIDELAKRLNDPTRKMNRYQLQEHCENFIMNEYKPDDKTLSKWQDCAYEKGLKMRHVHLVLAVELRKRILESRGHPRV